MSGSEITNKEILEEMFRCNKELEATIEAVEVRISLKVKEMKHKVEEVERENQELKNNIEYLENAENENNIVVFGLERNENDLISAVETIDNFKNLLDINLEESDLNNVYSLEKTANDLTPKQREEANILRKHLYLARQNEENCYIKNNKLIVRNRIYTAAELKATEDIFEVAEAESDPGTPVFIRKQTQKEESAIKADTPILIPFRKWELHMLPSLKTGATNEIWAVKTSSFLESPRYCIVCFQTDHDLTKVNTDPTIFNHANITNITLTLNGESYPKEKMQLAFDKGAFPQAYFNYTQFGYSYKNTSQHTPLLGYPEFANKQPLFVIDCSRRDESVKSSTVDEQEKSANTDLVNKETTPPLPEPPRKPYFPYRKIWKSRNNRKELKVKPHQALLQKPQPQPPPQKGNDGPVKKNNISPIVLKTPGEWTTVERKLESNGIKIKQMRGGLRIQTKDATEYRTATRILETDNHEYHTYSLPEDKLLSVVMRGIDMNVEIPDIENDLKSKGLEVKTVHRMKFYKTKLDLPLVIIQVPKSEARIWDVKDCCSYVVRIEAQRQAKIKFPSVTDARNSGTVNATADVYTDASSAETSIPHPPVRSPAQQTLSAPTATANTLPITEDARSVPSQQQEQPPQNPTKNLPQKPSLEVEIPNQGNPTQQRLPPNPKRSTEPLNKPQPQPYPRTSWISSRRP
ncbi:unnamed protein product [Phaedon cochleariae]|uniref:Uncharacterized protein n=1 Tax=Phaedon cochleariae TaxID=80249 RepID=A0A9N9SJR5_PHACE|nr:unnamed protein product [Phaedon cochleariae]